MMLGPDRSCRRPLARRAGRVCSLALPLALAAAPLLAEPPKKTLAEAIEIALQHHPDLGVATATVEAGRQRTWQAVSGALPQVNASYRANRWHASATARTGAPIASTGTTGGRGSAAQTFNFYSVGVSLSQILFDFGQSLDAIRAARATERSLEADATTARERVVFDAKQAYFTLLAARRLRAVAEENFVQARRHLDDAQGRYEVGVGTRFDVTRAKVDLANAELAGVTARKNVAVASETLRSALGLEGALDFDIVDTLDVHDVRIEEGRALALAYEKRPELVSERLRQEALSDEIAALRKSYLPNLTGDASYTQSGQDYLLEEIWNVGAAVNLSVFNGGLTTAQIGEARANLSSLKYQEQSLRQEIALQVRQAVLSLGKADEAIRVSETAIVQARENAELAEGRFRTGVGSILEVTDAQAALTAADGNHVQALSNFKTAVATLEQATAQSFGEDAAGR